MSYFVLLMYNIFILHMPLIRQKSRMGNRDEALSQSWVSSCLNCFSFPIYKMGIIMNYYVATLWIVGRI